MESIADYYKTVTTKLEKVQMCTKEFIEALERKGTYYDDKVTDGLTMYNHYPFEYEITQWKSQLDVAVLEFREAHRQFIKQLANNPLARVSE